MPNLAFGVVHKNTSTISHNSRSEKFNLISFDEATLSLSNGMPPYSTCSYCHVYTAKRKRILFCIFT